jgi:hypothetical protein
LYASIRLLSVTISSNVTFWIDINYIFFSLVVICIIRVVFIVISSNLVLFVFRTLPLRLGTVYSVWCFSQYSLISNFHIRKPYLDSSLLASNFLQYYKLG